MRPRISRISKKKLAPLTKQIAPLVRFIRTRPSNVWVRAHYPQGKLYTILSPCDMPGISFLWVAKRGRRARGIKKFAKITTYHAPTRYQLFAPTIAEILAQIPLSYLEHIVAFEVLPLPSLYIHESGLFEAEVILYRVSKTPTR